MNLLIVSPKSFGRINGEYQYYFSRKGGKRRFKLALSMDSSVPDGVGYVLYRGRYVMTVKLG